MLFNSLEFLVFTIIFFSVYFFLKGRNRVLFCLAASYVFYGWWDWRFLALIIGSTLSNFYLGLMLDKTQETSKRKKILWWCIILNLGILAFFKYFNFFIDSFVTAASLFNWHPSIHTLAIILPIGISFYTFQTMSYVIDVYKKSMPVEKDIWVFSTYVAFFPQLVAGPIVRAETLIPQFKEDHKFEWNRFIIGFGLVLLGFFKKVVVADSIAGLSDDVFAAPYASSSFNVILGVFFYTFQIYCDFSGYSDIAIGLAHIMGLDFLKNFNAPYFSRNFSEFWRRWHISLSSWLRDYLYIFALGGNRGGTALTYRNLMLTMLLGGLWHGANWTFVIWGGLHGTFLILQRIMEPLSKPLRKLGLINNLLGWLLVFVGVSFAWIFFRSDSIEDAFNIIKRILDFEGMSFSSMKDKFLSSKGLFLIFLLLSGELIATKVNVEKLLIVKPVFRYAIFTGLILLILFFGTFNSDQFIYFQF